MSDSLSAGLQLSVVSWTFPPDFESGMSDANKQRGIQVSEASLPGNIYMNFQIFLRLELGYDVGHLASFSLYCFSKLILQPFQFSKLSNILAINYFSA